MPNSTSNLPIQDKSFVRKISGFSLLEVLVSMAILGLLVTLLYSSFSQISRTSLSVENSLRGREELRLLMKVVLDDLQAMQYLSRLVELNESESPGVQIDSFETGLIARLVDGPQGAESSSAIDFHAARRARFYPEWRVQDPRLHEIGYRMQENSETGRWELWRREDFYVDPDLSEGGRDYLLTDRVTGFLVELLEQEIELADGGTQENWVKDWDTQELACERNSEASNSFCLPRAIRLSMAVEDEDGQTLEESLTINLCVRPCKPEWFE
ncbi:MAG: prepilin-type N-terminal cleavage/methylation domain-containing protein [Deltaproteobacteria bacterium]|jgi:prepilin-type N-terminal cleavage/methylation domain-containing protein|nr:prepilin-type N-terminal cleavage/methylation domain-containing protein [Deltaproteobacteria bacterium]